MLVLDTCQCLSAIRIISVQVLLCSDRSVPWRNRHSVTSRTPSTVTLTDTWTVLCRCKGNWSWRLQSARSPLWSPLPSSKIETFSPSLHTSGRCRGTSLNSIHRLLMDKSIFHIKSEFILFRLQNLKVARQTTAFLPNPTSYFSFLNVVLSALLCLGLPYYFSPRDFLTSTLFEFVTRL